MNRQVNYIITAVLTLTVSAGVFTFINMMPAALVEEETASGWCGTQSESSSMQIPVNGTAAKGKFLFMGKCASCHNIFKDMTGPGLIGFEGRGPWTERKNVYDWIRNPPAFMRKNKYTRELKAQYGSMMTAFPDLTDEEIDAICVYVNRSSADRNMPVAIK